MQNIKLEKCWYSKDADEETDKNIDESEAYIDHWYVLQYKLTQLLTVKNKDLKSDITVINKCFTSLSKDMSIFYDKIKNWLQFWDKFQKTD